MPTPRTLTSSIAPHLRENIFRTYEPYLHAAVTAWPDATWFDVPPKLATATFIAGIRNAVISLERYSWDTVINVDKLRSISGSANTPRAFIVALGTDGKVWFRAPLPPQRAAYEVKTGQGDPGESSVVTQRFGSTLVTPPPASLVPWRDPTDHEILAACLLIHKNRVSGPFIIDGEVRREFVDKLQEQYNVGLVYDESVKQTVIT